MGACVNKVNDLAIANEIQNAVGKVTLSHRELFAPAFFRLFNMLERGIGREFFLRGGRGSAKSTFVSNYILLALVRDAILYKLGKIPRSALSHAIAYRKIAADLRDSVFTQFLWSMDKIGVTPWFDVNKSNMRMTFYPTGQ